jgi:hypothetical protein
MVKMDILSIATPEQILPTIGAFTAVSAFTFIAKQTIIVTIRAFKCQIIKLLTIRQSTLKLSH